MLKLLLLLLLNQNTYLVEQNEVVVLLSDLDAYVYLLPPDKRGGFALMPEQIDKNIITMLNMNIIYDHIQNSELKNHKAFSVVADLIDNETMAVDSEFIQKLNLNEQEFLSAVREFQIKKESYARMGLYLREYSDQQAIEKIAYERYLAKSSQFTKPEVRDISVISLNQNDNSIDDAIELLTELMNNDSKAFFEAKAKKHSDDPTVSLNSGHWGHFRNGDLKLPFADDVFAASVGYVPNVFDYDGRLYLVKINEIQESKRIDFSVIKDELMKQITEEQADRAMQSIINEAALKQAKVNENAAPLVFERYKVFIE